MDINQMRRLSEAEKALEEAEPKGGDIDIICVTETTVRGEHDEVHHVPAYPNAKLPDDYEVTFESQNSDGSMHRVWKMKPIPQTHGIVPAPRSK